jgi:prepilin-type N-terminal cleavage/methylation domain-containing protein
MPILRVGVKNPRAKACRVKGFSLIEALLVIVLLGVLAAVVAPAFMTTYRGVVLKSTVRTAAATLRYVRASAIGTREEKTLMFDLQNKLFSSVPLISKSSPPHTIAEYIELHEQGAMPEDAEQSGDPISFEFSPSGSSNGGNLVFSYKGQSYLIEVSPLTGKVNVSVSVSSARFETRKSPVLSQ